MRKKNIMLLLVTIISILFIGSSSLYSWEEPVLIAGSTGKKYSKPIVKVSSTGMVYIVYKYRNSGADLTDIHCRVYDGTTMANLDGGEVSASPAMVSYEPFLFISPDNTLHFAWMEYAKNHAETHYIKYRTHNANGWSEIITLGNIGAHEVTELRMEVDAAGNVFAVFWVEPNPECYLVSKYAGGSTTLEPFPMDGRSKHADLAVDDNYVHIVWQFRQGGVAYDIPHAKRAKTPNSSWTIDPSMEGGHEPSKPRIVIDDDNTIHVSYYEENEKGTQRKQWIRSSNGNNFGGAKLLTTASFSGYHWPDLAFRGGSLISSTQVGLSAGGQYVEYNWFQNGAWSGPTKVPNSPLPKNQSVDISDDGTVAVFAYQEKDERLWLIATGKVVSLQAAFRVDGEKAFWNSPVTFDASESLQLNPSSTIVSYDWDFGDGTITSTTSPTISHTYSTYDLDMVVTLSITADNGAVGTAEQTIHVHALYGATVTAVNSKRIRTFFYNKLANEVFWSANPRNAEAGYPTISNYEIYRALQSSSVSESDYLLVGSVSADITRLMDYNGLQDGSSYIYVVCSVDVEGHKSPLATYRSGDTPDTSGVSDISGMSSDTSMLREN
ncbi:MAG: PKD domain-containing protein [bacterium]|nr:PKD domain-containing protein [bacterium]